MRRRGEMVERSFAHILDRGGMRRAWLRGRENIHKRYLFHVAGFNLGVLMRALHGQERLGMPLWPAPPSCSSCEPPHRLFRPDGVIHAKPAALVVTISLAPTAKWRRPFTCLKETEEEKTETEGTRPHANAQRLHRLAPRAETTQNAIGPCVTL